MGIVNNVFKLILLTSHKVDSSVMLCFKIVGFCSKLMVLFFPQFYSIILFADIAAPL